MRGQREGIQVLLCSAQELTSENVLIPPIFRSHPLYPVLSLCRWQLKKERFIFMVVLH